jgi:predicted alpha/beta hydrolase
MGSARRSYSSLPYDHIRDFAPLSLIGKTPNVLVVNPSVPPRTLKEFIDYVKANPGKYNYGSPGFGTSPQMTMELFKLTAGIDIVHVPYKGGAPALADVMGGQITGMFGNLPEQLAAIRGGKTRALAVSTLRRTPLLPDVPTVAESGYPGFEVTVWYGVVTQSAVPKPILAKLSATLMKTLSLPGDESPPGREHDRGRARYAGAIRGVHRLRNGEMGQGGQGRRNPEAVVRWFPRAKAREWRVAVGAEQTSAIYQPAATNPRALFVCAHGAGGHKADRGMERLATVLCGNGFDLVRFNFLYREAGARRPDPMPRLQQCFEAVVAHARAELGGTRLMIGGRSMGGRAASMMAAEGLRVRRSAASWLIRCIRQGNPASSVSRICRESGCRCSASTARATRFARRR